MNDDYNGKTDNYQTWKEKHCRMNRKITPLSSFVFAADVFAVFDRPKFIFGRPNNSGNPLTTQESYK